MVAWPASGSGRGEDSAGGSAPGPTGEPPLPGIALAQVLDTASGPGRRCADLSVDEAFEVLGRWDATEAWCASAKLGVIRALIRHRPLPGFGPKQPGGLPEAWQEYLAEEVALELGISKRAADALINLAWALEARLVLTARALDAGVISLSKARIIDDATSVLTDEQAAAAETLIAGRLAGSTHGQIAQMIARAVVKVDPDGARKRREQAQKEDARVRFWREHVGTAALAAFGLPPDQALAANQNIQDRALEYRAWGVPGTLDQLRVLAFLDSINGTDARRQYPKASAADAGSGDGHEGAPGDAADHDHGDDSEREPGDGPNDGPGRDPQPDGSRPGAAGLAANTNLTIPLLTLLGLAEHPGEAHGLGALDPDLARQLAASAACNPGSGWCVTVTDEDGHAIGHGCGRARRGKQPDPGRNGAAGNRDGPAFTFAGEGPPGGYGTWTLTFAGLHLRVRLGPIPVTDCDHRYESKGYQPSDTLRHLVEIRDGQCTLPVCVRQARRCDFEHAVPWHKGGRTCACNGGCRCRHDHKVKQTPGWAVTQPMPGYHQWTTPAGRTYTSEPMRYPV
jgi:hypothetical protein